MPSLAIAGTIQFILPAKPLRRYLSTYYFLDTGSNGSGRIGSLSQHTACRAGIIAFGLVSDRWLSGRSLGRQSKCGGCGP